ncbi:NEDD4 family-interacting protein 1-like isoform X1 [Nasonia vitripennis]|uniref:NEDD4 family-interacting protein 1-like n=1 Tax=Nasonia vitripennis TaxID=7425 RepID=A0A7M7G331_NASVI|nr:NEDD4 family-interacting protein 1-like isoform X1 [Nasonia vitripennis]
MDNDNVRFNMSQQPQAAAASASSVEGEASLPAAHSAHSGNSQMNHNVSLNQTDEIVLQQAHMSSRAQAIVLLPRSESEEIPPPKPDFSAPPPYEVATKLPSYEEVQREKTLQGEPLPQTHPQGLPCGTGVPQQPLTILAIDTDGEGDPESRMLGTDFMFFTAFLVAFLFNWIGFLLLMCFCHTIASRYGALSGFGLSLTKWTLIVKHSTDLASRENSWLWWLIMAFGMLICVRAIIQYLNIKRGWRLLSGSAQERLLFYY